MNDFIRGMGTILAIFPNEEDKPVIHLSIQTNEDALKSDWEAVGNDLMLAAANAKRKLCEEVDCHYGK